MAKWKLPDEGLGRGVLTLGGFQARIEFDGEDEIFVGRLIGIPDIVGFHADTVTGLRDAMRDAVEEYRKGRE